MLVRTAVPSTSPSSAAASAGAERPGHGHALGPAAGELGGFAVGEVADAQPVEPLPRLAPGLPAGDAVGALVRSGAPPG